MLRGNSGAWLKAQTVLDACRKTVTLVLDERARKTEERVQEVVKRRKWFIPKDFKEKTRERAAKVKPFDKLYWEQETVAVNIGRLARAALKHDPAAVMFVTAEDYRWLAKAHEELTDAA